MRVLELAAVIRLLRSEVERAGGQAAWAKTTGIHRTLVNSILNGRKPPSKAVIKALKLRMVFVSESGAAWEPNPDLHLKKVEADGPGFDRLARIPWPIASLASSGMRPLRLAEKAGVTANTVTRIENGADAKQSTMDRLQGALEAAGVEFTNGDQPGVRLTRAAAAQSTEAPRPSKRAVSAKAVRGKTAKATEKKR